MSFALIRRVAIATLIWFALFYLVDQFFLGDDRFPSNFSIAAVALLLASWPMGGVFRFEGATAPVGAERIRLILLATAFWIAIGTMDLTGPRHTDTTLETGATCLVVSAVGNTIRTWRLRRAQRRKDPGE